MKVSFRPLNSVNNLFPQDFGLHFGRVEKDSVKQLASPDFARPDEVAGIMDAINRIWKAEYGKEYGLDWCKDWTEGYLDAAHNNLFNNGQGKYIWVIRDRGKVIAASSLLLEGWDVERNFQGSIIDVLNEGEPLSNPFHKHENIQKHKVGYMAFTYVEPNYRGKGYAVALHNAREETAKKLGVKILISNARPRYRNMLIQKFGFSLASDIPKSPWNEPPEVAEQWVEKKL
ncbi:MAG: GNAT family N-acetyltransferase [Vampirovibrio sp.]|nr:GNAT family N-acetyltransferase [Vampirovibrio sp.]